MSADWPARWVRSTLGYEPRDVGLFAAALTHRSASGENNERLEFLGDAVLNLVIAEHLYRTFPDASEGDLSRLRARIVSREPLAEVAATLGIGDVLQLGSGELKTGGFRRQSILADAFEALCGAVFLDGGLDAARRMIHSLFEGRIANLPAPAALKDPKTRLQEHLQARGLALPLYRVDSIEGEPHAQTFSVTCEVPALGRCAQGRGSSRRRAEQEAAARVLQEIDGTTDEGRP
ncbi:MAG: ribonuclease III [Pseudomonadota bacterium]|jgi:ribonuclease III, bacterial|nr:MAG: ribonuclease III [Pseudomonadota bacterium]